MARISTDNELGSCFYLFIILLGSTNSIKAEVIPARTLAEFRTAGWEISGSSPTNYVRPGAWKSALRPLDASVSGGSVWRVTSSADTIFRFDSFISELCAKSITVEVRYFMENTVVSVNPWNDPAGSGSEYFYPKQPSNIQWETETIDIIPGNMIEFKMNVMGGYIFFDQISIEHDGVKCDTTTTTTDEPTTTDPTRTSTDDSGWTSETPVEESVEPGTGTTSSDEEVSSTTQITTEEPTTPDEGIPEEPETGGTGTTNIPTLPSTAESDITGSTESSTAESDITGSTESSTAESDITGSTESSTAESDITGSTESSTSESDTTGSTESSTSESDTTGSTESSTSESDITGSTESSTSESDITGSTESSTSESDITTSTESSTTESDITESTDGSTTDDSSTTMSPITPSIPPTSETTSSSTESTSETTLTPNPSSNTPTQGVTPPQPSTTSTTKIPVIILPPPVVLPGTEKQGLTVQQILLYIVLPTAVGITAFLGTVFYFGFKGYKWWGFGSKGSKEQLIREGIERASNRGNKNPTQVSPPQQTSLPPSSRQIGNNNVSLYPSPSHQLASHAFPQTTPVQLSTTQLPRQSPSAFQSQFSNRNASRIPSPTSRPNMGKSVTLNIPNQEEIYYGTSGPSNWNGSSSRRPVTYTGEYTGGELPRIRRKMD